VPGHVAAMLREPARSGPTDHPARSTTVWNDPLFHRAGSCQGEAERSGATTVRNDPSSRCADSSCRVVSKRSGAKRSDTSAGTIHTSERTSPTIRHEPSRWTGSVRSRAICSAWLGATVRPVVASFGTMDRADVIIGTILILI
jgi:hypothetical protein